MASGHWSVSMEELYIWPDLSNKIKLPWNGTVSSTLLIFPTKIMLIFHTCGIITTNLDSKMNKLII